MTTLDANKEKEKEKAFQKKRLELFNNNDQKISKIVLSDFEKNFLYSKYVNSERNISLKEIYHVFFENVEKMFNENLALIVFPFFSDMFTYSRKINVEIECFNKLKFTINEIGFTYDDYEKIGDFLKEPTGSFKNECKNITYENLKLYSDLMLHSLLTTIESVFIESIQKYTSNMSDVKKKELLELSRQKICVKKTNELIKDFSKNYYPKIESLNMYELFLLFNLEEEKEKLKMKKEDAILFKEQHDMIDKFIQSFKNNKDKKIIISSRGIHNIIITNKNEIMNDYDEDVKEDFSRLINRIIYDRNTPASIIVQEKTGILSPKGIEQFRICGLIIKGGDFKVINKELIKNMYLRILDKEELEDEKSYRFFDWFYKDLPDFN